jgi:hypothetical protein
MMKIQKLEGKNKFERMENKGKRGFCMSKISYHSADLLTKNISLIFKLIFFKKCFI